MRDLCVCVVVTLVGWYFLYKELERGGVFSQESLVSSPNGHDEL